MSTVAKLIELSAASSRGIEDAVQTGLGRCAQSVKNIRSAWINETRAVTDDDGKVVEWRVNMRANFLVD